MNTEHTAPEKDFEISLFGVFCLVLLVLCVLGSAMGVIVSAFEKSSLLG